MGKKARKTQSQNPSIGAEYSNTNYMEEEERTPKSQYKEEYAIHEDTKGCYAIIATDNYFLSFSNAPFKPEVKIEIPYYDE